MFPPLPPLPGPVWWKDGVEVYPAPDGVFTERQITVCPWCESIFDKPDNESKAMECPCCGKTFLLEHELLVIAYKKGVNTHETCLN